MGILSDYFAAASDEQAATAIEMVGGPGSGEEMEKPEAARAFDTVALKGIEPFVKISRLEALLTRRAYDEVAADPRNGELVAMMGDGEVLVTTLSDSLRDALAAIPDAELAEVALPWSQTEEFVLDGVWNVEELTSDLRDLAGLARRAQSSGQRLYCWSSL